MAVARKQQSLFTVDLKKLSWTFLCGLLDVLNVPPWVLSSNAVSFNSPKNMQVGFLDESRPKV